MIKEVYTSLTKEQRKHEEEEKSLGITELTPKRLETLTVPWRNFLSLKDLMSAYCWPLFPKDKQ